MLLANLLGWHRREQKPDWWRWFSQLEMTEEELIEAREPLAGLELLGVEDEAARTYRYRYPEQDFDVGKAATDPVTMKQLPVVETDLDRSEIVLRFPRGREDRAPASARGHDRRGQQGTRTATAGHRHVRGGVRHRG